MYGGDSRNMTRLVILYSRGAMSDQEAMDSVEEARRVTGIRVGVDFIQDFPFDLGVIELFATDVPDDGHDAEQGGDDAGGQGEDSAGMEAGDLWERSVWGGGKVVDLGARQSARIAAPWHLHLRTLLLHEGRHGRVPLCYFRRHHKYRTQA